MPAVKKYTTDEEKKEAERVRKRNAYRIKHGIALDAKLHTHAKPQDMEARRQYHINYMKEYNKKRRESRQLSKGDALSYAKAEIPKVDEVDSFRPEEKKEDILKTVYEIKAEN